MDSNIRGYILDHLYTLFPLILGIISRYLNYFNLLQKNIKAKFVTNSEYFLNIAFIRMSCFQTFFFSFKERH